MVNLGIIGVANPEFREKFCPALHALKQKTRVSAIYDCVAKRAELAARQCEADVCLSFEELIRRDDIDAILMLSPGWPGLLPILSCMELRKPVLCTRAVWQLCGSSADQLDRLAQQTDSLLVIENEYRYWPSSLRARELQASELGRPLRLLSRQPSKGTCAEAHAKLWADLLDWSRFLLQRSVVRPNGDPQTPGWTVQFVRERAGQTLDSVPFVVEFTETENSQLTIECETGSIDILGPNQLRWQHLNNGVTHEPQDEQLNEQPGILRQIDHFCRRVAGGLIPVYDLTDALWAERTAAQFFREPFPKAT